MRRRRAAAPPRKGSLFTCGTCHKGLAANLGSKDGAFGRPWDELAPFRVGSAARNGAANPPLSPFAAWPPRDYAAPGGAPFAAARAGGTVVSAHIHAAALDARGAVWAWGCGSNDGRCGVERFLNMAGDGKPPRVDEMKCYMMGPHRVGIARAAYWPHGPSLAGVRVLQIASGRNHMACIGVA